MCVCACIQACAHSNTTLFWGQLEMQRCASHLEHLAAEALPLLIRSYDTVLVDEARRTQRFDILWRLCCPRKQATHIRLFTSLLQANTKWGRGGADRKINKQTNKVPSFLKGCATKQTHSHQLFILVSAVTMHRHGNVSWEIDVTQLSGRVLS